jgi:hypothetical protein
VYPPCGARRGFRPSACRAGRRVMDGRSALRGGHRCFATWRKFPVQRRAWDGSVGLAHPHPRRKGSAPPGTSPGAGSLPQAGEVKHKGRRVTRFPPVGFRVVGQFDGDRLLRVMAGRVPAIYRGTVLRGWPGQARP